MERARRLATLWLTSRREASTRCAVVTGAATGIGRATALAFARERLRGWAGRSPREPLHEAPAAILKRLRARPTSQPRSRPSQKQRGRTTDPGRRPSHNRQRVDASTAASQPQSASDRGRSMALVFDICGRDERPSPPSSFPRRRHRPDDEDPLIFAGSASPRLTAAVCRELQVEVGSSEVIRFSEGTLFVAC